MHPLLLYVAIREDQAERRRRQQLERAAGVGTAPVFRPRGRDHDRRRIRDRIGRFAAVVVGRRARPA